MMIAIELFVSTASYENILHRKNSLGRLILKFYNKKKSHLRSSSPIMTVEETIN